MVCAQTHSFLQLNTLSLFDYAIFKKNLFFSGGTFGIFMPFGYCQQFFYEHFIHKFWKPVYLKNMVSWFPDASLWVTSSLIDHPGFHIVCFVSCSYPFHLPSAIRMFLWGLDLNWAWLDTPTIPASRRWGQEGEEKFKASLSLNYIMS